MTQFTYNCGHIEILFYRRAFSFFPKPEKFPTCGSCLPMVRKNFVDLFFMRRVRHVVWEGKELLKIAEMSRNYQKEYSDIDFSASVSIVGDGKNTATIIRFYSIIVSSLVVANWISRLNTYLKCQHTI